MASTLMVEASKLLVELIFLVMYRSEFSAEKRVQPMRIVNSCSMVLIRLVLQSQERAHHLFQLVEEIC